ncbi:MAG: hypothetical protein QOI66_307 [Myxococcales bacterium]|jgi:HEAT repeat protein|nr:hypothetical protein [Myxococcales bacterium]
MLLTDRWAPSLTAPVVVFAGAFFLALSVVGLPARAEVDRPAMVIRLEKAATGLTAADAGALGPGEIRILFAIVDDRAAAPALRARALAALGLVRTPAAHEFLENLLIRKLPSSDPTDRLLLRKGAVALGWQSGPRVVETLTPLLNHPDPDVRLDAVVALGLARNRTAEKPLQDRLTHEDDANVRRQITTQLRLLSEQKSGLPPDPRAGGKSSGR